MSAKATSIESQFVGVEAARPRWIAWAQKGSLAITDQGLMSGSNFFLSILLARWLTAAGYGAYALAFAIFLLVSAFHQALLLEPVSVLGPSIYHHKRPQYLRTVLDLQAVLSVAIMAVLAAGALLAEITSHADLADALGGLAIGGPFILFFWFARGACYLHLTPAPSAFAAGLYSFLLLSGAWIIFTLKMLTPGAVFVLTGAAALVAGAVALSRLRVAWKKDADALTLHSVWREHWKYGRWALASLTVNWIPGNVFYPLTAGFLGMSQAGAFRALMNLTFPVSHSASAFSLLLQPHLSRVYSTGGRKATLGGVRNMTLFYGGGALLYGVMFFLGHGYLYRILYGGKFMDSYSLIPLVILGVLVQVSAYGPTVGLRAIQAPDLVFRAYAIAAAVCLLAGIPFTWRFGLAGAVVTTVLSPLAGLIAAGVLYLRRVRAEVAVV